MNKLFKRLILQAFCLLFSYCGFAQIIDENPDFSHFTLEYLAHKEDLTIEKIVAKPKEYQFFKDKNDIKKRTSSNNFWIKVTLKKNDIRPVKYLLEVGYPPLKYLDFYKVDGANVIEQFRSGFNLPIEVRSERFRNHLFPIEIQDTLVHAYYLNIRTLGNMKIPISLHEAETFQKKDTFQTLELGIGIGLLFLVSIAASILFLFIRKRVYVLYSLYILFVVLFILSSSGLGFFYFWPQNPEWNLLINRTGLYGLIVFAALFTLYFLRVNTFSKSLLILLIADAAIHILFLTSLFLGLEVSTLPRVTFSSLIHSILLIVVGVVAITKNKGQAVLYTVGVILFWVITVIHILSLYELSPYVPNLLLLRIAWYVEVLFLTIAVIYNFKQVLVNNKLLLEKNEATKHKLVQVEDVLNGIQQETERQNKELLASNLEAAKRIEELEAIRDNTEEMNMRSELERLIQRQNLDSSKSTWEEFKIVFDRTNPSFFERISNQYPQLTNNDLRYAAYVKVGLTSKEIAALLNVNVDSLKNTRYRIRKKINLDSSVKVNEFLQSF